MESQDYIDPDYTNTQNLIDISFRNIVYKVEAQNEEGQKYTKTILHGVSGIFKAGELNVIMGASGAGKTTLLNILAGRISEFEGETLANGQPYNFQTFGDFANYVMQGDILMQTLTVRESLQFAANLKLDQKVDVKQRVQTIVKQLKLEKCIDVVVGGTLLKGISGGEKKRTSLAIELISNPQVVALDEPTSGMDSLTSFIIINQLKQLTKSGKTIFLTIHQPNSEIFALFDRLFLMIEGKFIYQGDASYSLDYFADNFGLVCPQFQNPADYYIAIMHHQDKRNVQRYEKYFEVFQKSQANQILLKIESGQKSPVKPRLSQSNFFHNIKVLLKRDLINIIRNPMVMQSRIIQVIFMSIYTGGLYFNAGRQDYKDVIAWYAIIGYLFFVSMDLFMQAMMPVTITFPLERLVFLKEQNSKMYKLSEYFLSRNLIQIPYIVVIPFLFLFISYWMIGLGNTAEQFFTMYLIIFLMSFTGTSAGMLAGSMITDPKKIAGIISMAFVPILSFSGYFKNYSNMPDWNGWIRFLSPFNYSFTALVGNETMYKASRIDEINFDVSMWIAILIQFCLGIGFRIISYLFLMFKKEKLQ